MKTCMGLGPRGRPDTGEKGEYDTDSVGPGMWDLR